jgi:hypothetical protein
MLAQFPKMEIHEKFSMERAMKINRKVLSAVMGMTLLTGACSSANKTSPAPTQPAAPPAAAPANKPTTPAGGTTKKSDSSPKADSEKKTVPSAKKVEVPADWVTLYDESKGYEFEIPDGSQTTDQTVDGVDVYTVETPAPSSVQALIFAFKNKELTKDDLLTAAEEVLKDLGCKDIKFGTLTELSDDYDLAEATFVDPDGKKSKVKILVATDVTDNYIMIVGTDEDKFKANEQIIDGIWGSFSMYSGGASGDS